jgi:hypothetical protein
VEFEKGNGMLKPELLEELIFNSITWAPRIWRPWDNLFDCRVLFRSKDIREVRFVRPILIFRTKRYWILFRIGPGRRRKAKMTMDLHLFSNSPDPIVPVFGMSSAKVTDPVPLTNSGVILDIIFYIYRNTIELTYRIFGREIRMNH